MKDRHCLQMRHFNIKPYYYSLMQKKSDCKINLNYQNLLEASFSYPVED